MVTCRHCTIAGITLLSLLYARGGEQDSRVPRNAGVGPFRRLIFAFAGLLAGNVALLLLFLLGATSSRAALLKVHSGAASNVFPEALDLFYLYSIFSVAGWLFVGVPIALLAPARLVSRLTWPLRLLIGVAVGPLALILIFILLALRAGQISTFSLVRTGSLWPFSILVSTVSFVTYAALLRRRAQPRATE